MGWAVGSATLKCNALMIVPTKFARANLNIYDVRIECENRGLCYDFTPVVDYLQSEAVMAELGTTGHRWKECNYRYGEDAGRTTGQGWGRRRGRGRGGDGGEGMESTLGPPETPACPWPRPCPGVGTQEGVVSTLGPLETPACPCTWPAHCLNFRYAQCFSGSTSASS